MISYRSPTTAPEKLVNTRGGTHRKDRKRTVVRVAFHQGVILGIEFTRNKESSNSRTNGFLWMLGRKGVEYYGLFCYYYLNKE
jgi:hypothetical protein